MTRFGSIPLAIAWVCSRYAEITQSSSRSALMEPAHPASCPMWRWQKPPIFPIA